MKQILRLTPLLFLGCANISSEPIPPHRIKGWGIHLYNEGAEAAGGRDMLQSRILVRIENMTSNNWDALVLCRWVDAGDEEEFAREEQTIRLPAYSNTRTWMRQFFFTQWRISIRCTIEELETVN